MFRKRSTILWLFLAPVIGGCEMGPTDIVVSIPVTTPAAVEDAAQCGEARPAACVIGCGLQSTGLEPFCQDGRWHCDDGVPSTVCPAFTGMCEFEDDCGWGYHCVQSLSHPIPWDDGICRKGIVLRDNDLESCSSIGLVTPEEFLINKDAYLGQIIKLSGTIDVDIKCSKNACGEDACCNTCVGNYKLTVRDPKNPEQSTDVTIQMDSLACNGTTCDVACGPLDVGGSYTLWGVLDSCHGAGRCSMLHMGACPL